MSAFVGKYADELIKNPKYIATPGKGILAADESTGTIGKLLSSINVENIESNRQALSELLFASPGALQYLSGVILFEETLTRKPPMGNHSLMSFQRTTCYRASKWTRALLKSPAQMAKPPHKAWTHSEQGVSSTTKLNAHGLARYAIICQENGLVPIVEPEILTDGPHDIKKCAAVTEVVLAAVYKALNDQHVLLEGTLLKPNMVTPGSDSPKVPPEVVAEYTVAALRRTVPAAVPGIVFLSGGQSEEEATLNLNATNKLQVLKPWTLSFSFGRALQQSTLKTWAGKKENVPKAQQA
ncbi:hypothetical protein L6164_029550 [Bauhinia variegata]|uniref:Uncharacterized protein n=1 Tax=Bauhinia variegata TaxID=167791 RepID=A0ACB9L9G6_BAUVA|nr:hypothetical protein L6164_029550 [Bauhinia variegata]